MKFFRAVRSQINQIRSFSQPARLYLIAIVIDGISYCGWSLFFNFYILQRGFDKDFLGLVNAMPSIGILLLGIPMGRLSDRIGRRWAMIIGATISICSMSLEVIFRDPLLILLAAFINGAASSLYTLSQAPFMMKTSDAHNRDLLFSLNFGLITLSGAVGSTFAGHLPSFFGNLLHTPNTSALAYRAVLLTSMVASFLLLVPLLIMKEPPSKAGALQTSPTRISLWGIIRQPVTIKLALPNLLIGLGAAILMPYVNVFFSERFSVTNPVLGVLFGLSAMLTGIGALIGPRLARSLGGKIHAVAITQASSLVFLLLMGFAPWAGLSAGAYLVRGMLMNMAFPLLDAFSMEQVDEGQQGVINSVRNLAWQFGWAVGPFLSGLVQERYGFSPLFVATCILYGISTWLTWIFFHKKGAGAMTYSTTGELLPTDPFETMRGP